MGVQRSTLLEVEENQFVRVDGMEFKDPFAFVVSLISLNCSTATKLLVVFTV